MNIYNQKAYNKARESQNLIGTKAARRKKYKKIIQELGVRNITLKDISDNIISGRKGRGFLDMMDETGMTMDDLVILQQYGEAILERDTKAAEFLRDTVGEKPSTQVDLNNVDESGISKMSLEELQELKLLLEQQKYDE